MSTQQVQVMEKLVALCRRRGFIFGSSEIYGGIGGFWDYGPLGTELKRNIKNAWWHDMVTNPPAGPDPDVHRGAVSMVGVDCSIIMNPKVWEASGHVGGFSDQMVDCTECKKRFRADSVYYIEFSPVGQFLWTTRDDAELAMQGIAPTMRKGPELTARTSAEGDDLSQVLSTAEEAVRQFTKKNNLIHLKGFTLTRRGREADHFIAFAATDGRGTEFEGYVTRMDHTDGHDWDMRPCPSCQAISSLTEPRSFNLMFKTYVGALQDESSTSYLRPETAQGIFANFKNVLDTTRVKIPFGIAQIGKAFRNEINPRNYTFRSREFEQMEIEFFCKPDELCRPGEITSLQWYEFWRDTRLKWYESLGIRSEKLRPRQQGKEELAHYSKACTDVEYLFPFSDEPQELEGIAHRGCFDLSQHGKFAKGDENAFAVFDEESKQRFVPHVVEPSAGVDRFTLAALCEAYTVDESRASPEFLKFHPRLAPIKAAVFPLVAKDGLPEIAEPIYRAISKHYLCQYDAKQSIGKRYARMDEAGTPFCFTIDGQSKEDGTVTVRNRDDASQIRIDKTRCLEYLRQQLAL